MAEYTLHDPGLASGDIPAAAAALGDGPLTEAVLARHIHPLFSRVLTRDEIYLSNHSLGRPLDRTAADVARFMDLWYRDMDDAWPEWLAQIDRFRAGIATLIGISRPDAVVPKPGAGQGLRAVLNAIPKPVPHIVATRGEFDSIDFILKAYAARGRAEVTWVDPDAHGLNDPQRIIDAVRRERSDLVVVSHIYYSTGQLLLGIGEIAAAAHDVGGMLLLDAYHSAGVVPMDAEEMDCDFVIGGSYKYTRGGPGAGWLAIHPRNLERPDLRTLDTGWFAKRDVFSFQRADAPHFAPGGDGWLECTPIVLTAYQAAAGLELALAIGIGRLRAYSLEQQVFLREKLEENGVSPRRVEPHGAFMLIPSADAPALVGRLKAHGVNTDSRLGNVRICPDLLNTREELARAAAIITRESR